MKDGIAPSGGRAAAMRLAFDRSFATLPVVASDREEDFVAVRIGSGGYAFHLSHIAGLFTGKRITPLPSRAAALLGIAGFRGNIAPVYDLHLLLGHPRVEKPAWLATAAGMPVAFAFEAFDGHIRVPRAAIVPGGTHQKSSHVREYIGEDGLIRPIIHLPSILELIRREAPEDEARGGKRDV
jgi:chemotaxis signal transduction protein